MLVNFKFFNFRAWIRITPFFTRLRASSRDNPSAALVRMTADGKQAFLAIRVEIGSTSAVTRGY